MKHTTIKLAFPGRIIPTRGKAITLDVGGTPHRFFLHRHGESVLMLSHYASGYKLTEFARRLTMDEGEALAQAWLNARVADCGLPRILDIFGSKEVINYEV